MINTCKNNNCDMKDTCYRFKNDSLKSFNEKNCVHYWNIRHSPKKQIL